jgi:hypothetical protein
MTGPLNPGRNPTPEGTRTLCTYEGGTLIVQGRLGKNESVTVHLPFRVFVMLPSFRRACSTSPAASAPALRSKDPPRGVSLVETRIGVFFWPFVIWIIILCPCVSEVRSFRLSTAACSRLLSLLVMLFIAEMMRLFLIFIYFPMSRCPGASNAGNDPATPCTHMCEYHFAGISPHVLVSSCFRHVRTRAPSLAKFRVPSYLGLGTRIHRTDEITHRSNKSKMHQFRTLSCKPLDCVCHFALRDIKVDCSFGPGRMN